MYCITQFFIQEFGWVIYWLLHHFFKNERSTSHFGLETDQDVDDIEWNWQALCVKFLFVDVFGEDSATPLLRNASDNLGYFFFVFKNLKYFSTSPTELLHQTTNSIMTAHNMRGGKSDEGYKKSTQTVLQLAHKMLKDRENIKSLNLDARSKHSN